MKKINKTKTESSLGTFILVFAIVAVAFAATNAYVSFNKNKGLSDALSGFATDSGYVNVSVVTLISINFTKNTVNWGSGSITSGENNASLDTVGPTVSRGSWSNSGIEPFVIENIGGVNASLSIKSDVNATTLLGGSAGHRRYSINVTVNETGSCDDALNLLTNWTDVNVTDPGTVFCNQFGYLDTQDELRIDLLLVIPYDGNTGNLSSTLTATANTAA